MAITNKHRALAGIWFTAAAALPVLAVAPTFLSGADSSQLLDIAIWLLSPLLISAVVGTFLGAAILDPRGARGGWRAALRGLLVAIIAYLLYAIVLSTWEGYANHGSFSIGEAFTRMLIMMVVTGTLLFGWVVTIVGALAGWILHLVSVSGEKRSGMR